MTKAFLFLLLACVGCYGRPTPSSCQKKYVSSRHDPDGYNWCMVQYRIDNGQASESDWAHYYGRKHRRPLMTSAPLQQQSVTVVVQKGEPLADQVDAGSAPPSCARWQCETFDGGEHCSCR